MWRPVPSVSVTSLTLRAAPTERREGSEAMTPTEDTPAGRNDDTRARERGSGPVDRALHARRRPHTPHAHSSQPNDRQHGPNAAATTPAPARQAGPTITAVLEGGPLAGRRIDISVVEGRPPKTIDVRADDGRTCRYGLADWVQTGPSARYASLYLV